MENVALDKKCGYPTGLVTSYRSQFAFSDSFLANGFNFILHI